MWSRRLKVRLSLFFLDSLDSLLTGPAVIARSALAQEEAEEFSGEFSDPINIHLDNNSDGCAC